MVLRRLDLWVDGWQRHVRQTEVPGSGPRSVAPASQAVSTTMAEKNDAAHRALQNERRCRIGCGWPAKAFCLG